jgi:hypothetical protein
LVSNYAAAVHSLATSQDSHCLAEGGALVFTVAATAGDPEGLAHWVDRLDSGDLSRAEKVERFACSLEMKTKLMPYAEDGCVFI